MTGNNAIHKALCHDIRVTNADKIKPNSMDDVLRHGKI